MDEAEAGMFRQFRPPRLLEGRIVVGVHVVDADDGAAVGKKTPRDMKADEPGGAGHQDGLAGHSVARPGVIDRDLSQQA